MLHVYRASAGSGKTYELAYRYIRQQLRNLQNGMSYPHRDILAVTFTNKATEEMTKRIVHELAVLAGREHGWEDKRSPYADNLIKDLGLEHGNNPDSLLAEYAGKCLDALLADFDRFSVSTIDAFFQTVLRAFTREAELAGDYEIELDNKSLVSNAVAQLLEDIDNDNAPAYDPHNRNLSRQIKDLMSRRLDEANDPNFFNREGKLQKEIVSYVDSITNETFAMNSDKIVKFFADTRAFDEFINSLADTRTVEDELRSLCAGVLPLIDGANVHTLNLFRDPDRYIAASELPAGKTLPSALQTPEKNFKKGEGTPEKIELLQNAARMLKRLAARLYYQRELQQQVRKTTIFKRILDAMEAQRSETSTILLSDTNTLLRQIIDEEEAPFIYERVGNRYRHFLIDEFQDTSAMQWANFKPLLKESLASGHETTGTENESLIIGDEKQSIYGFRNSDSSMLTSLSKGEEIPNTNATTSEFNWRSSHTVVKFNNAFFTEVAKDDPALSGLYDNVVQSPVKKTSSLPGNIHAQPLNNEDGANTWVVDMIDNIIGQLERGYRPGDIAVLLRTNGLAQTFIEKAGELARAALPEDATPEQAAAMLRRSQWLQKMKFAGEESVTLASSTMVQMVINILRFIGASDFTLYRNNMSERELALIFSNFERKVAQGTAPTEALSETLAERESGTLEPLQLDPDTDPDLLTLPSMVQKIINEFVSQEMRIKENLFLSTFLDTVNQYCTFGIPDIRSFLNWWDSKGAGIKLSVGRDLEALTVMTIHKSKGLEFPCVHYMATPPKHNGKDYLWVEGSVLRDLKTKHLPPMIPLQPGKWMLDTPLEDVYRQWLTERNTDEVNLVYVAMTRPVNELNIYYQSAPTKDTGLPPSIYDKIGALLHKTANVLVDDFQTVDDTGTVFNSTSPLQPKHAHEAERPGALDPEAEHPDVPPVDMIIHSGLWKNTVIENEEALPIDDDEEYSEDVPRFEPNEDLRHLRSMLTDLTDAGDEASVRLRHFPTPAAGAMLSQCLAARPEWFGNNVTTARIFKRPLRGGKHATGIADRLIVHNDGSMEIVMYKRSDLPMSHQEADLKRLTWIADLKHPSKAWIWDISTGTSNEVALSQ